MQQNTTNLKTQAQKKIDIQARIFITTSIFTLKFTNNNLVFTAFVSGLFFVINYPRRLRNNLPRVCLLTAKSILKKTNIFQKELEVAIRYLSINLYKSNTKEA